LLEGFEPRVRSEAGDARSLPILKSVAAEHALPEMVVAIDGSHHEVEVENGFPGAEASYVTVASVMLDLRKMRALDERRPIKPQEFYSTQSTGSVDAAFPGRNVIYRDDATARDSLRRTLFGTLAEARALDAGETLLETYEVLLRSKPPRGQVCPYREDCGEQGLFGAREFVAASGGYSCPCPDHRLLYSSDALRIHEGFSDISANGALFAEIMQVLEHLTLVNVLRSLERVDLLEVTRALAFVMDGPLAVFGHPAWLSRAVSAELVRINALARRRTGRDLLILGIEKTGMFVEHFARLDLGPDGSPHAFPHGGALLMSDAYIKRNVIPSLSEKFYGLDTYYGRKWLYKTQSGHRIVATIPFLDTDHRDLSRAEPGQYPRLGDAVALLEELASAMYPNAVSPLVAAHAEAAIPLHLGQRVLEKLARELIVRRGN
jgi:hypothetical protein